MVISQLKKRRNWIKRRSYMAVLWSTFWGASAGVVLHSYLGLGVFSAAIAGIPIWIVVLYYRLPRGCLGEVLCSIGWISAAIDIAGSIVWGIRKSFDREYQEDRNRRQNIIFYFRTYNHKIVSCYQMHSRM